MRRVAGFGSKQDNLKRYSDQQRRAKRLEQESLGRRFASDQRLWPSIDPFVTAGIADPPYLLRNDHLPVRLHVSSPLFGLEAPQARSAIALSEHCRFGEEAKRKRCTNGQRHGDFL